MGNKNLDNNSTSRPKTEEENLKANDIKSILKTEINSNKEKIKFLINGLSDKNGLVRRNNSEELGRIGKAALPDLIIALLNSKNVIQRRAAAKTLKLVEDP